MTAYDPTKVLVTRVLRLVWPEPGDPHDEAMREACAAMAVNTCHETGDEDSYVAFCARTVRAFLRDELGTTARQAEALVHENARLRAALRQAGYEFDHLLHDVDGPCSGMAFGDRMRDEATRGREIVRTALGDDDASNKGFCES